MELGTVFLLVSLLLMVGGVGGCAHMDVTPEEARRLMASTNDLVVIDVREPAEFCDERGHIPGALNYPYASGVLQAHYRELPMEHPILVVCRSGRRSNEAATFLDDQGFSKVYDMIGGMKAWLWETAACEPAADSRTPAAPLRFSHRHHPDVIPNTHRFTPS